MGGALPRQTRTNIPKFAAAGAQGEKDAGTQPHRRPKSHTEMACASSRAARSGAMVSGADWALAGEFLAVSGVGGNSHMRHAGSRGNSTCSIAGPVARLGTRQMCLFRPWAVGEE